MIIALPFSPPPRFDMCVCVCPWTHQELLCCNFINGFATRNARRPRQQITRKDDHMLTAVKLSRIMTCASFP